MNLDDQIVLQYSSLMQLRLFGEPILLATNTFLALDKNRQILQAGTWPPVFLHPDTTDLYLPPSILNQIREQLGLGRLPSALPPSGQTG